MIRLTALVSGLGWHVQDLLRAASSMNMQLEPILFTKLSGRIGLGGDQIQVGERELGRSDGILVRMMPPGSLEQVIFRMDALYRLEASGVPVLNPSKAVEAAVDKYLTLARLAAEGIPVPETWVGESAVEALEAFERLGGDVVVKPLFGSEGRGLVRVSEPELAFRAFRTLERLGCVLYVQKYVKNRGSDVRVFVLGDCLLGSMARIAPPGDWRANVSVGGRAERFAADREVEQLSLLSAKAVGAIMAGVDLLRDRETGRWTVLEVNAVPGWKALGATTGVDVASAILDKLREMGR